MKNNYSRLKWVALIIVVGAFFFLAMTATAANTAHPIFQQQEVYGIVRDQKGLPIPGVTITIDATSKGTVTNLDGEYTIVAPTNATLVFSYIGFKTHREKTNNRKEINIQLQEDISALGEVKINAGYYNTTRRESTGNISRVTAEEIELQPVVSPLQALQGRMAGVEIVSNGNLPGNASTIRIRGTNSLREEGNFPLYIIDGVPLNSTPIDSYSNLDTGRIDPLNTLNLSNIESIEVLKDADATAIYGSRGANGIILITTKKGRIGKTELSARYYTGASSVPNRLDLLDTEEYLQIRQRAFENDGEEPMESNAYDLLVWDQNQNTDWQDQFFGGTSAVTDINLNATGGNKNTSFRLSGSYHSQGSVYLGDYDYQKVTAGANINHSSENKRLNLNFSINYGADHNELVGYMNLSEPAFRLAPNAPSLFTETGLLNWEDWSAVGLDNPLTGFHNHSETRINNFNSNLVVSYELAEGFRIKSNFGYTNLNGDELVKRPKRSYNPASSQSLTNRSNHRINRRNSWIIEPQIIYNNKIGKGNLDALLGGTFQQSENNELGLQGEGYVSEALIGNLSAAENILSPLNQNFDYRYNAIFARLGFNWDKKYYINLTGRRDGSSRFGPGKRWANFGAVGGAWIFSEQTFIENFLPFISFGKLRGSYGTTGNDQIGDYGYFDAYESTIGPGGLYPNQLSNPNYSWEVNKKLEAALELGLFKGKINLGLSWYSNRSSSQLVGFSLPAITGFSSVQANLPATVENTGLEIEFSSFNIRSGEFRWQTSFNLTFPRNKLISYPDIEESSYANTYRVGQPLNISLLYEYDGLNPETNYYKVRDINEDGTLDFKDRVLIWDRNSEFFGGIDNSISYKNFSLQFLWQFVKQEGMLALFDAGPLENQRTEVVQALGSESRFQQISSSIAASRAYNNVLNSDFPIVDASYLRLKTLNLAYAIPDTLTRSLGLSSGKLFIGGQNLLTITSYQGMDPEKPGRGSAFAGLRSITGGIQLNF
ncbi:TonB-linked outer membrane protein, SusC/RagA family [Salegentibacter echinorum]|uniref:TonB-linked outer membrane protein, SusC/RagA family n=1 Tax=Salegentibacter echinorum TaxID=1073325 RepID=A0A1M5JHX4_SALEC|nr:SusC/RagA family TonB-linked outer membrane protein [Salegentibacter echinorum]SHG40141.1 TonB-linked outer membrane protein, SusC/RagA family [Salegentibacter echinorum]